MDNMLTKCSISFASLTLDALKRAKKHNVSSKMKIGNLGTRTTKLYFRNSVIFIIAMAAWWAVVAPANSSGFGKFTFWLSLPFWLIGAFSALGIYSIGPLGKGIKEAVMKDEAENNEKLKGKKPWE